MGAANVAKTDKVSILIKLIKLIEDLLQSKELDYAEKIVPNTYFIANLGFSSQDLVILVVDIQEYYQRYDLPFDELFAPDGEYVRDLRVIDMCNFLYKYLSA